MFGSEEVMLYTKEYKTRKLKGLIIRLAIFEYRILPIIKENETGYSSYSFHCSPMSVLHVAKAFCGMVDKYIYPNSSCPRTSLKTGMSSLSIYALTQAQRQWARMIQSPTGIYGLFWSHKAYLVHESGNIRSQYARLSVFLASTFLFHLWSQDLTKIYCSFSIQCWDCTKNW